MTIRIGTWNIAAARKMISLERFDYSHGEELEYFAEQLRTQNLDVICIQESHANKDDSLAKRLADLLDMPYVSETSGCPSHIDSSYMLTTAIISRLPFNDERALLLPQPTFELKFQHNNKVVLPYDHYIQTIAFSDFMVANIHTEPLGAFGLSYNTGKGKEFANEIDTLLVDTLSCPLLFAADFNMHELKDTLPLMLEKFSLRDALPNVSTKPHGTHPDHILYSPEWLCRKSSIVKTQSDHFLCWCEFDLKDNL